MCRRFVLPAISFVFAGMLLSPGRCAGQTHYVGRNGMAIKGELTEAWPQVRFNAFGNREIPAKPYNAYLYGGARYRFTMDSPEMDSVLVIKDGDGQQIASDDDSGGNLNSLITLEIPKTGTYKIYTGSLSGTGQFLLKVVEVDSGTPADVPGDPVRKAAETRFKQLDKNGVGYLTPIEMPEELKANFSKYDKNGDNRINLDEYLDFRRRRLLPPDSTPTLPPSMKKENTPTVIIVEEEDLDQRPMVYRAGKLPKGLPDWFGPLDTDRDGQVALWEWRAARKNIEDFARWDRNDDGFITAEEVVFKLHHDRITPAEKKK